MKTIFLCCLILLALITQAQSITGTVYDDGNGLRDSTVNGVGANINGSLNVTLFNSAGYIVTSAAIQSNGSYSFSNVPPGSYFLVLNNDLLAPLYATLPDGWLHTGEHVGAGRGSDGAANGRIDITVGSQGINEVNFGVDKKPVAFDAGYTFTVYNPGGNTKVVVPTIYTSDLEDGSGPIIIKTLPTYGTLYYDSKPLKAGDTIYSYINSKLLVDPSDGSVIISFTYFTVDNAGATSNTAQVLVPFGLDGYDIVSGLVVPVQLSNFEALKTGPKQSLLRWTTESELNSLSFTVYRSVDGLNWDPIHKQPAAGTINVRRNYSFTDFAPLSGKNFYKLQMTDIDGSAQFSNVRWVYFNSNEINSGIDVYPNPAMEYISVKGLNNSTYIKLYDITGKQVYTKKSTDISREIYVGNLARGIYQLIATKEDGAILYKEKIVKQ